MPERDTATGDASRRDVVRGVAGILLAGTACRPAVGTGTGDDDHILQVGLWSRFERAAIPRNVTMVRTSGYAVEGLGAARYALDPDQSTAAPSRFRQKSADGHWFRIAEPIIGYTMAGARGDGIGGFAERGGSGGGDARIADAGTDDTPAIQALYDYLASRGGGVALVEARQFNVTTILIRGNDIRTVGTGPESHVHTVLSKGRPNAFVAEGADATRRLRHIVWENLRVSGSAMWGDTPAEFNDVLCGFGIRTRWVDDVRVGACTVDHVSDSGVSIQDGRRPIVEKNRIRHVAQGIDIFYECDGARVIGNVVCDVHVFAGINVEGKTPGARPRGTLVADNAVDGVTTSGIDVIEAVQTVVTGNRVTRVSGRHAGYPGYSFGIQIYGSPATRVSGNEVSQVAGTDPAASGTPTGIGICIGANSGGTNVVSNIVFRCSRAAFAVNDTHGTHPTHGVLIRNNRFDSRILLEGDVSLDPASQPATGSLAPF